MSTINIKEADQTKQVADNAVDYKDLEIQVNGSYAGFKNFLLLMESNLRIMDLQQINFQVVEESNNIQYNMVIRVYYQK